MLTDWGLNTLNLTAGDWVRLEVPSGPQGLTVQQPLLLGSDIIITGISTAAAAAVGVKGGSRGLLHQQGGVLPVVKCGKNATSAVSIK